MSVHPWDESDSWTMIRRRKNLASGTDADRSVVATGCGVAFHRPSAPPTDARQGTPRLVLCPLPEALGFSVPTQYAGTRGVSGVFPKLNSNGSLVQGLGVRTVDDQNDGGFGLSWSIHLGNSRRIAEYRIAARR